MRRKSAAGRMFGLLALLCVLVGGILVATGVGHPGAPRVQGSPTPQHRAADGLPPPSASTPARLRIPALGVDASIEPVGLTSQRDMDVPRDPRHVGWYRGGPVPGQPGDAVIDGHLNWTSGPAVFWNLDKLRAGDQIQITDASGHTASFQVASSASYPSDQPPPPDLFSLGGQRRLSLITCAGDWTDNGYSRRLVVGALLASDQG